MNVLTSMLAFFSGLFAAVESDGSNNVWGMHPALLVLVVLAIIAVLIWVIRALR